MKTWKPFGPIHEDVPQRDREVIWFLDGFIPMWIAAIVLICVLTVIA